MNDAEITRLLRAVDGEVELRPDREASVRAAMLAELDRATGAEVAAVERSEVTAPRRRRGAVSTAAACVMVLLVGFVALRSGDDEPRVSDEVAEVAVESYLRSCVDFQDATERDGTNWLGVLTTLDRNGADDPAYRSLLAGALSELAEAPRASAFSADLEQAATDLDAGTDLTAIITQLRTIEASSLRTAGLACLR